MAAIPVSLELKILLFKNHNLRMRNAFTYCTLLVLVVLLGGNTLSAALSGTYTINAGAPASATNYTTVGSAVSDLTSGTRLDGGPVNGPGVSGPVTLRIAAGSGPYTEQVSIGAIAGTSSTNYVRLTGGPTRETIQFTATTTADRHVVRLTGTKNIILDSLTLINNGATYGYGVWITNNADSNFVKNSIVNVSVTSTSSNFCGIAIAGAASAITNGDNGDNNTIQGNIVSGGYYGFSASGNGTTPAVYGQKNHLIDNEFREFYYYGIRHYGQNNGIIRGNTVHARSAGTTAGYGMYIYYNDNFVIERNKVYDVGNYGIYMYYANYQGGSGITRATVRNNFIGGTWLNTSSPYGIYVTTNTTNVDFFHNSISLTVGNGRCMYFLSGTGNDVRNNIFSITNSTTGYAFYSGSATYAPTVDYNDYWAPGSSNFVFLAVAYTPATYVGGGGFNTNSLNVDPSFVNSASNLHIASGLSLYDAGANLGVTNDYDGQTRPLAPSTGYDIGADEFLVAANDAGAWAMTSPVQPFGAGTQNVDFQIHNFGLSALTSATFNWRVNGVLQAPYAWSGSLAANATSTSFTAGTYNFVSGTSYSIKAWTSNPNGSSDANAANDTLNLNVCVGMSGVYTIGGVGADFPTLTAAVDALQCGGVAGAVTFNLTQGAGPFNEQVIIPVIPGASATRTIRFNGGANRETVQFSGTTTNERAVIKLNGADHIILDSLTIINNDVTYAHGVHLTNNADSNVVSNSVITVDPATTSSNFAGICITGQTATTAGANGNGNQILNNTVNGGYYGISIQGLSTTVYDQNNTIEGNTINDTYYYPIRCYSENNTLVKKNVINFRTNGSTSGYMMYIYYADNFNITQNDIKRGGAYGIYCYYGNYQNGASSSRAKIVNNMIGGSWLGTAPYGIYLSTNCVGIDVYHNSVSVTSGNGRCLYVTGGSGNDVRNNSFSHTGSSTGYAAYVSSATYISGMNYNNYYAPGSSNFIYVGVAYSPTTYQGGGGFNTNSRDGDPNYVNPVSDLHAFATQLFDAGDPSVGVLIDFDDQVRPNPMSTVPDIGGDEYEPDSVNIATTQLVEPTNFVCPDSFQVVKVVINNKGTHSISNIALTTDVTGPLTTSLSAVYPGPLAFGSSDTVTMGTINTWSGGVFGFRSYHAVPNDQNHLDDTLTVSRNINVTPAAPVSSGSIICAGDSTTLIATATGSNYWYDAPLGGNLVAPGDSLHTGPLAASTTYYVESRGEATASLLTTFANNNSCGGGNMFDVTALQTVTLDSFDLNISGTASVSVYYKVGTHLGFETNAGAWTLLGTQNVLSAGSGNPSRCTIGGLTIPSGQTYGIFISTTTMVYTTLTVATNYTSPEMVITTGTGLCGLFSGTNFPRGWNGRVYYQAEGCPSQRTPVSVQVNAYPTVAVGDTSNCGLVTLDAGNPGMSYVWSTGDSTQTIDVTSSGTYHVTVSNGSCGSSDSAVVTINTPAVVNLGPDDLLCNGGSATLDAGNPGSSYLWSNGDSTQTTTVTAAGTYYVDVTTPGGCVSSDTMVVTTLNTPSGSLTADLTACPTVTFTGNNVGGTADVTTWHFGDGSNGTGTNPTHTYAANGSYAVSFVQSNACGTDSATFTLNITCIVGITLPNGTEVSLYPNPTQGTAALRLVLPDASDAMIEVSDLQGRVIYRLNTSCNSGATVMPLDLSKFSAGVYVVHVTTDGLNWQGRLVKE
jgi:hypothetical protein